LTCSRIYPLRHYMYTIHTHICTYVYITAYTHSFVLGFFLFLAELEFELRALCLQSWHSTTWAIPPVHFCSGYFGDGISGYFGDVVLWTICLNWSQTMILLVSASKVLRITNISYQHLTTTLYFDSVIYSVSIFHMTHLLNVSFSI
jgi:hypothetical protein